MSILQCKRLDVCVSVYVRSKFRRTADPTNARAYRIIQPGEGGAPRKKSKWDQSSKVSNVSAAQQQAALAAAAASTGVAIADFMRMQGTK